MPAASCENAGVTEPGCVFCDLTQFRTAEVYFENTFCVYASTRDPRDPPDVLPGCGVIIPIAHVVSPFDFTAEEWSATHDLLLKAKAAQDERLSPDGYTLIWNSYSELGRPHASRAPARDPTFRRRAPCRSGRPVGDQVTGEPTARSHRARRRTSAGLRAVDSLTGG